MATTIPVPRSYSQIVADMTAALLAKLGIPKLKVGGPVLQTIEAVSMSQLRASQDIFGFLAAADEDAATGLALERKAADVDLTRRAEAPATGVVTISDSRYTKIASKVYAGKAAPLAGTTTLNVVDASSFDTSGSVYIGRGTPNVEGPLAYTSKAVAPGGAYWTLALAGGSQTRKFHNTGETVVMAQGGTRSVGAGVVVQTPTGSTESAQFSVLYAGSIPDGEVEIQGVQVVAKKAGTIGNVPNGAINSFVSPPFPGAAVTNPANYSNGRAVEGDESLRDRLRNKRRAPAGGTVLTIEQSVLGITAPDEAKSVISSSLVSRKNHPSVLYIDDGTGYEERDEGVAFEALSDGAIGGEKLFKVLGAPVARASVGTLGTAPFALVDGANLAFKVGGVLSEHSFAGSSFRSIGSATAYEVSASINADPDVLFSARTADGGTRVVCFAKEEENEDIEAVEPDQGTNANDELGFPTGRHDTLLVFKNDRLLSKDGKLALVQSNPFSTWGTLTGSQTLEVAVDETAAVTYTFTDADFVSASTGYSTLGNNSPAAWVKVFNAKIPGITCAIDVNGISLTSNVGRSARAQIAILSGSLTGGMFDVQTVSGQVKDYSFDRNTGDLELVLGLATGDRLSTGSGNTRGFVESSAISPVTLATDGLLYLALDGRAVVLSTGIKPADTFDVTKPSSGAWGARYRITANTGSPFADVEAGNWLVIWDTDTDWDDFRGVARVVDADTDFVEIELEDGLSTPAGAVFGIVGVALVQYAGQLQRLTIPSGVNKTANAFADDLNDLLEGSAASTFRTTRLRVRTNTRGDEGDTAVVAEDVQGAKTLLEPSDAVVNNESDVGSVEAGNPETGTPSFQFLEVDTSADTTSLDVVASGISPEYLVQGARNRPVGGAARFGNNRDYRSAIQSIVDAATSTLTLRRPVLRSWIPEDRFSLAAPYSIGPEDQLGVLIDNDPATKHFVANMWRSLRPTSGTYGAANDFQDIGDGTATEAYLAASFGTDFNFDDFAVFMRARAKSHSADSTKAILWRHRRFGAEGEGVRVAYTYPAVPDQGLEVLTDILPDGDEGAVHTSVVLPSGGEKTGYSVRNSTSLGYGYRMTSAPGAASPVAMVTIATGFPIASAERTGGALVTLILTLPTVGVDALYSITDHGLTATPPNNKIWVESNSVDFPSGTKTIVAVSPTHVQYAEAGANVLTTNIGTLSFDSFGEASFAGATPSVIVPGDLFHLDDDAAIPSTWRNHTIQITHVGDQFIQGYAEAEDGLASDDHTLVWQAVGDATLLSFYSLGTTTATSIVTTVNALGASCPVSATLLGDGSGDILQSSRDELLDPDGGYILVDGLNWVKTTTNPPNETTDYTLEFKEGVDADLVADSDWINEEVRLVPLTTKNVVDWLGSLAVSGIPSVGSVEVCDQTRRPQISTQLPGSDGSVEVQGGGANEATATVAGSARTGGGFSVATFQATDMAPFRGQRWVSLDNSRSMPKDGVFTSATDLVSLTTGGIFTLSGGSPDLYSVIASAADVTVQVEKQGSFVAVVGSGNAGVAEGDWVYLTSPTTPVSNEISDANKGIFRVVRSNASGFWIENASAIEETLVKCDVKWFTADSMMPGDILSISTDLWDADNQGLWTVDWVGDPASTLFSNVAKFRVSTSARTPVAVGAVGVLGADSPLVTLLEAVPARAVKRIVALEPNQDDDALLDVKFDTDEQARTISEAAGTVMTALDKLDFPLETRQGVDGYSKVVGLLGEATRVVYGDARDRATYPGIVAEGASVSLAGPLVRRLQVALVIRIRTGAAKAEVAGRVRAAVAAAINTWPAGRSIPISLLVAAASRVYGVTGVAVASPEYDSTHDVIALQPSEKGRIMDVDQDVVVTFLGD